MGHFESFSKYELKTSYDSGATWESTTPPTVMYEKYKDFDSAYEAFTDLPDCVKAVFYATDGTVYTYYCGDEHGNELENWPDRRGYNLIVVGKCITCIADGAFYIPVTGMDIKNIIFPKDGNLECIGTNAFYNALQRGNRIIIPSTVKRIGNGAFGCDSVGYYEIQGRPRIEDQAFIQGRNSRTFKFLSPVPPEFDDDSLNCIFHCGNVDYYCPTQCNDTLMYPEIGTEDYSQYDVYFGNVERFDIDYQTRWVDDGFTCIDANKWAQIKEQFTIDDGLNWFDSGVESATTLIEANSPDCGYATRTISGGTYCTVYDLYVNLLSQETRDSGTTWTTTATTPSLVERNSQRCHYSLYEYIETPSTTSYYKINTNFYPDATNTIVIKCRLINSSVDWGAIVGWAEKDGDSGINDAFRFSTVTSNYEFIARRGSTNGLNCRPNRDANTDYLITIPLSGDSLTVTNITADTASTQCFNGDSYTYPSTNNPMHLLGYSSNFTKQAANIRIYYIQVLDANGNVIKDYRPSMYDDAPCFFEMINNEFITDTYNTSELILGDPV